MILNAANHGKNVSGQLINFPVLFDSANVGFGSSNGTSHRGLFPNLNAFANYLHTSAIGKETAMAQELEALLNGNHA